MDNRFTDIIHLIKQSRENAIRVVNTELINLYWNVGEYISKKIEQSEWGDSVVTELAKFIQINEPEIKGFSDKNIWRMKQFYESYKDFPKLSPQERESKNDLTDTFKDSYVFEFLNLPEPYNERDLQRGLVRQMKNFILELGKDFLFIGEEYKLQVGNSDFFIDLLFYHRGLQCLVAFELKADKFKPDHLGQLNFYLESLDRDVKKPNENPSIGILLCKDKDSEVVEYALSRSLSPTMVSEYKTQLPDKKLLQQKLHELFDYIADEK
jgi:predicted nuclease of restriction endonuclease-like (RecB) superfamily